MTSVYGQYSLLICCHHLPTTCSLKNIVERLSCHQLVASVERLPLMPVCSQLTEGSTQQRQSCWMWSLTCYEQLIEDRSVYCACWIFRLLLTLSIMTYWSIVCRNRSVSRDWPWPGLNPFYTTEQSQSASDGCMQSTGIILGLWRATKVTYSAAVDLLCWMPYQSPDDVVLKCTHVLTTLSCTFTQTPQKWIARSINL